MSSLSDSEESRT